MKDVNKLLDNYYKWLRDKAALKMVEEYHEITAPYLDRHNDYIQIYLKKTDDKQFTLSDAGSTIIGLKQDGCEIDSSSRRRDLLNITLKGFGVNLEGEELSINSSTDDFPLRKHSLIQAMLAVNDMFYLATPLVKSIFYEDVRDWLDQNDIRYTEHVSFTGQSGYPRKFDFVIPKSKQAPERILHTINEPRKNTTDSLLMNWIDSKNSRPASSALYVALNDNDNSISSEVITALRSYEIHPLPFSQRENSVSQLIN